MANRNRSAGHKLETDIVKELADLLNIEAFNNTNSSTAQIGTSRQFSKNLDAQKVDIWLDPSANPFDLNIQAKCTKDNPKYEKLLDEMPDTGINIVWHRKVRKSKTRFMRVGEYVTLRKDDFLKILQRAAMDRIKQ